MPCPLLESRCPFAPLLVCARTRQGRPDSARPQRPRRAQSGVRSSAASPCGSGWTARCKPSRRPPGPQPPCSVSALPVQRTACHPPFIRGLEMRMQIKTSISWHSPLEEVAELGPLRDPDLDLGQVCDTTCRHPHEFYVLSAAGPPTSSCFHVWTDIDPRSSKAVMTLTLRHHSRSSLAVG